jgi:hypothetical protein
VDDIWCDGLLIGYVGRSAVGKSNLRRLVEYLTFYVLTYLASSRGLSVRPGLISGVSWKIANGRFFSSSPMVNLNSSSFSVYRLSSKFASGLRVGRGLYTWVRTGNSRLAGLSSATTAFLVRGARSRGALTLTSDRAWRILRFFGGEIESLFCY